MTRKSLKAHVYQKINDYQVIDVDAAVDVAIDTTLVRMIEYTQNVSMELVSKHLYSEAMVAGTVINKLKELLDGNDDVQPGQSGLL